MKPSQYFCDFEFWSAATQLCWLPLHVVAPSVAEVEAFIAPLQSGLTANYRLIRATAPTRIVRGLRSPSVAEFQKNKLVGIPNLLDRASWTMRSARSPTHIAFEFLPATVENFLVDLSALSAFAFTLPTPPPAHFTLFNLVVPGE